MQDGRNSSSESSDQPWKENRRNQRNDFEGQMGNDRRGSKDKMGNRNERRGADDRMGSQNDRMGSYDDRSERYDKMGSRGSDGRSGFGERDNVMGNNGFGREDNLNGRNDFQHDFGNVSKKLVSTSSFLILGLGNNKKANIIARWFNLTYGSMFQEFSDQYRHQSTQPSRRYKREKKEENSGKRSQFNPNPKGYHDLNRSGEKTSSEKNTTKDDDKKACALHCFLENLEMVSAYSVANCL